MPLTYFSSNSEEGGAFRLSWRQRQTGLNRQRSDDTSRARAGKVGTGHRLLPAVDGTLLVLRGNSGSGKSTVACALHQHFDHGRSTLIAQDNIRRTILREPDTPGAFNIELIELIATTCLPHRQLVISEGILDADRYAPTLETLATRGRRALFYRWDLTFEQTLTRHTQRPQATELSETEMRS